MASLNPSHKAPTRGLTFSKVLRCHPCRENATQGHTGYNTGDAVIALLHGHHLRALLRRQLSAVEVLAEAIPALIHRKVIGAISVIGRSAGTFME
jgi:hypothetical protein